MKIRKYVAMALCAAVAASMAACGNSNDTQKETQPAAADNTADAATAGGKTKSGRTKTDQRAADGATGSESGPRRGSSGRTGRKYGTDHGGSA